MPREFVPDPQKLKITYTLNGKVMQDADTSLMVHSVYELVSYGSNILPLQPGDVIKLGKTQMVYLEDQSHWSTEAGEPVDF